MSDRRRPPRDGAPQKRQPPPRRKRPPEAAGRRPRSARAATRRPPRRPKKNVMTVPATLAIVLFFGFVIAYMGLRAYGVFSPNVEIMTLRLGNMADQQSVPGMIIRYEEVFHSPRDGHVFFTVQEFDRVRDGMHVVGIRDVEAAARTEEEWERLQREVMGVHEMRHATASDPIVQRVNTDLRNRMNNSMHHYMQTNLSDIYSLLNTLSEITENRNRVIVNESVHTRQDLSRQFDVLNITQEMNLSDIYATRTGIMSPIIDGFETRFTPENMTAINREEVRLTVDHEAIIPARQVEAGDEVFKIVSNNRWYVASWMPHEMVRGLAYGADRTIFLENTSTGRFEPIPVRVTHFESHHHDAFVIFRITRNIAEFLHQRNVNIRVTENVQSGFPVPTSAIATRRYFRIPRTHVHGIENYFVMQRREDGVQPIPIQINDESASHVYVLEDSIRLFPGDELSPVDALTHTLHIMSEADMDIAHGVYRTTRNYAEFRAITLTGEIPESGNVLLDPAQNPQIRQFDSIVIDAAMVREGQVVR